MTYEEEKKIVHKAVEASMRNDREMQLKYLQMMPLEPHFAKAAKRAFGKEFFINSGWDLSEAEAVYGKNWLAE